MIYPISFCIPECKIVSDVPSKTRLFAHIVPGQVATYIYGADEKAYYAGYAESVFGITHKKAGWDCMRHYEILANGCIPYFGNLDACPPQTMTHFPKALVKESMALFADAKDFNSPQICRFISSLLRITRERLTTRAMAQYVLKRSGHDGATRVLYLSQDPRPDYLRCLLLHGFKELLGPACHDHMCVQHLYTDYSGAEKLYGKGISCTCLLSRGDYHNPQLEGTLEADISAHRYDAVVYGSVHRGLPLWDHVCRYYADKDVILLCGEDMHQCELKKLGAAHDIFIREL